MSDNYYLATNILLQPFTDTIYSYYFFLIILLRMIMNVFFIFTVEHVCFIEISTSFIIVRHANFYGSSWFYAHSASSYKKLIFCMNHPSLERIFCKHILHKKKSSRLARNSGSREHLPRRNCVCFLAQRRALRENLFHYLARLSCINA